MDPQNDKFNVSTVSIYDVHGRAVHRINTVSSGTYTWNASGLPAGVYLVRAVMGNRTLQKKIMLVK